MNMPRASKRATKLWRSNMQISFRATPAKQLKITLLLLWPRNKLSRIKVGQLALKANKQKTSLRKAGAKK